MKYKCKVCGRESKKLFYLNDVQQEPPYKTLWSAAGCLECFMSWWSQIYLTHPVDKHWIEEVTNG